MEPEKPTQPLIQEEAPPPLPPPPPQISSPLSSPTHEFSFTLTLHPSPISTPSPTFTPSKKTLDLSPADDIFLHGHLLPLHPLHHPPRPSVDHNLNHPCITHNHGQKNNNNTKEKRKSSSFSSIFRRKVLDWKQTILKKYADMIFFSRGEKAKREIRRRPYSYSASSLSSAKERERWTRRKGEFSLPASMRTSPTNSGLLCATPAAGTSSASSESSMEELQSAIQAAIAHCKSSATAAKERQV